MDLLEIVWLFQSSPLLHCDSLQKVSTAPPLCSVHAPAVVDFCHQRRHMAAPRCLSNVLTVSCSPIPNYLHNYLIAMLTNVAFWCFQFILKSPGWFRARRKVPHPAGLSPHVAQDMAALCSLAFMRKAAMLEVFRSGSMLRSYALMAVGIPDPPNRLPMWVCPMWPPGLGMPRKSDTPLAEWGWGVIHGVTVSQGTTQPGRGDAALLPPIQEGFWIWNISIAQQLDC